MSVAQLILAGVLTVATVVPDDLEISWDDFRVRVIIIAPTILRSTLDIVNKINYPVDLIEVKRWVEDSNHLLLVNKLEQETGPRIRTVKGLVTYDEEFYKKQYNKNSAVEFLKYCDEVQALVEAKGWPLERKYNKHYCGFKAGFFNAFGVMFVGSKTFAFFFKIPEEQLKDSPVEITRYDKGWKQAFVNIEPGKTKVKDYLPLFELAYKRFAG